MESRSVISFETMYTTVPSTKRVIGSRASTTLPVHMFLQLSLGGQ